MIGDDMRFDFRTVLTNLDSSWIDCVNAAIEVPMCGPSRAALFKGMYSSRTGVTGNSSTYLMNDADTIATRIRSRGFSTVLSGKYLNDFPWTRPATYVPPGWDVWNAAGSSDFQPGGMWPSDYIFHFAAQQMLDTPPYHADVPLGRPDGPAPAGQPARPLRQRRRRPAAESPSFNEADVSDKPINQQFPMLSASQIADHRPRPPRHRPVPPGRQRRRSASC